MRAESRSLSQARLLARAPRLAVLAAGGLLGLAGLRGAIAPPRPTVLPAPRVASAPATVAPFAEAFVRDYLTWSAGDPADRERRLAGYLADGLDSDGGVVPASGGSQRPVWTAAGVPRAAERASAWRVAVIAALRGGRRITLLVPVAAGAAGSLAVTDYPALTALAARGTARADQFNDQIDDAELERVVERALRNYLAGNATDLAADLAPGAHVTTPDQTGRLLAIDELAWQQPGRAAAVLADAQLADGNRIRLRFHLSLRRDRRWFVAAINTTNPPTQGATP